MADYQSILAYDGTEFAGFQRQRGRRTVQGEVEEALRSLGWNERSVRAAGRTDTGVHATGQVLAYGLTWSRSPERLTAALNARLPRDAAVVDTRPVPPGFHPRYAARWRRYCYRLTVSPVRRPLQERYAWRVWPAPDVATMQRGARALMGEHDFGAFGTAPREEGHTRRTVRHAEWEPGSDGLAFVIEANAFLYRMVRRLVAALVAAGQGTVSAEAIEAHLADPASRWQGKLAPAQGLCLEAVAFEQA